MERPCDYAPLQQRPPYLQPDKGHLHHRLLAMGMNQKQAVLLMYAITAVLGIAAVLWAEFDGFYAALIIAVIITAVAVGAKKNRYFERQIRGRKNREKIKLMTVFGTGPEAIKMCPLVLAMRKYPDISSRLWQLPHSIAICLIRYWICLALRLIMIQILSAANFV